MEHKYKLGEIVMADRTVNRELDKFGGDQWKAGKIEEVTWSFPNVPAYWIFFMDGNGAVFAQEEHIKPMEAK